MLILEFSYFTKRDILDERTEKDIEEQRNKQNTVSYGD